MAQAKQTHAAACQGPDGRSRAAPGGSALGGSARAAGRDPLTGLPDRLAFCAAIDSLVDQGKPFGLFLADLDHFRQTNDTVGPDAGDVLLVEVADRLRAIGRPLRSLARTGDDEFGILLQPAGGFDDLAAAASRILSELGFVFDHRGSSIDCACSIGASLFPAHGETRGELLRKADIALAQAKELGRGRAELFDHAMLPELEARAAMLARARRALAGGRLEVHYQPKIRLRTGGLTGFEALLRVADGKGPAEPDSIAAAFENRRLAMEIGRRVLERVIGDACRWIDRGHPFGHVAINVTDAEVRDPGWAPLLLHLLGKAELPPWTVQVEVTETVLLSRSVDLVRRSLGLLHSCGVRIALDDFGTGFASLANLREFPVDTIKIDKSFVAALDQPDSAALVQAIIGLGKTLGMEVVAEGVERRDQHERLREWGCDQAQGFLYGAPARQPFACPTTTRLAVQSEQRRKKNCSRRSFT